MFRGHQSKTKPTLLRILLPMHDNVTRGEAYGSKTRSRERQSDSKRSTTTGYEGFVCLLAGSVKPTCQDIRFYLFIPLISQKFFEPF